MYDFQMELLATSNVRTLTFVVTHAGPKDTMQRLLMSGITVLYEDLYIVEEFDDDLEFTEPTNITIPVNDPKQEAKVKANQGLRLEEE